MTNLATFFSVEVKSVHYNTVGTAPLVEITLSKLIVVKTMSQIYTL